LNRLWLAAVFASFAVSSVTGNVAAVAKSLATKMKVDG